MNKKFFIVMIMALVFGIIICSTSIVLGQSLSSVASGADINISNSSNQTVSFGRKIYGIVHVAGIIISVGTLMIMAIKYMIAPAEQKAEQKKRIPLYITGAVFVFAIAEIANVIDQTMANL